MDDSLEVVRINITLNLNIPRIILNQLAHQMRLKNRLRWLDLHRFSLLMLLLEVVGSGQLFERKELLLLGRPLEHHLDGMSVVNQGDQISQSLQRHKSKLHGFTLIDLYQVLDDVFVRETDVDGFKA